MGYYKITQFKMPRNHELSDIPLMLNVRYGFPEGVSFEIKKKSVDARKKDSIFIVYNLNVHTKKIPGKKLVKVPYLTEEAGYEQLMLTSDLSDRPIVVGAGPCGLFAALILAEAGVNPIVFERGEAVVERLASVEHYYETGELNTASNIQFGEGGAGTFSDGKINTGVKDKHHRIDKIIDTFIEAGAPDEVRYVSKPHIGTDYLIEVVKNIRQKIIALGGEVRFNTLVTSVKVEQGRITGVTLDDGTECMTSNLILAIWHSARDTFEMLVEQQIPMEKKAFAVGLRIEHPQAMISESQYGRDWRHPHLPVADYKLTYRTKKGRGVYSFCMCPGGYVVNSASEQGRVVCNGMSNFARDEVNANSAILVNVHPEDFEGNELLAGVAFQRKWEAAAYELAGSDYSLPVQRFGDFVQNRRTKALGSIKPNIKGQYSLCDLNDALPTFVSEAIKEGISAFGRRISGFDSEDAVLTGVETRSSSPIRILRDSQYRSSVQGLYPCGEGAGYAGGIMSAALDGIKVAEAIIEYNNNQEA